MQAATTVGSRDHADRERLCRVLDPGVAQGYSNTNGLELQIE